MQRDSDACFSLRTRRGAAKGAILSRERMAPFRSPKRTQGALPLAPAALAVCSLKSCTRCAIRCGVHGFAMNPYRLVTTLNRALLS